MLPVLSQAYPVKQGGVIAMLSPHVRLQAAAMVQAAGAGTSSGSGSDVNLAQPNGTTPPSAAHAAFAPSTVQAHPVRRCIALWARGGVCLNKQLEKMLLFM